ncbi:related to Ribonuclease T2-like [Zygosaccharomyces bailii]|nr:related to Ribonuclease T2-like [Zygosaccharomyces bailii]
MHLQDLWSIFHPAAELFGNLRDDPPYAPHCPINLPLSCQNHSTIPDSCCFEHPGGIFLQTQFWDYDPSAPDLNRDQLERELGPLDSFTIHGLWPDNCAGGYEQFCDPSSTIRDVSTLLKSEQFNSDEHGLEYSGEELLEILSRYWKGIRGNDEPLWIHEFNKHGTCIKTIKPNCYSRWEDSNTEVKTIDFHKQAVYDYFRVAYNLYKKLNTSEILAAKGIVPSTKKVYTRQEIEKALNEGFHGLQVHLVCDRNQAINEVWYYHVLKGSLLGQQFVPIPAVGARHSNCPESGVKFLPKGYHVPSRRPLLTGFVKLSGQSGFLVKNGHWMTKGTPATFSLLDNPFGDYYLRSRNGLCGFNNDGALQCNRGSQGAAQFGYDEASGGYLTYAGSPQWNADSRPQGMRQAPIYHGDSGAIVFKLKFEKRRQY